MKKAQGNLEYIMILAAVLAIAIMVVVTVTQYNPFDLDKTPGYAEAAGFNCKQFTTTEYRCHNATHSCIITDRGDRYTITDCDKLLQKYCTGGC